MIIGVGTDICSINRFENYDSLAAKILTNEELNIFQNKKAKQAHIAKRFAAKEAISKAFGTGIGSSLAFKDIIIINNENGKPEVTISEIAKSKLPKFTSIHLSISDEKEYAVAFAVLEV